LCFTAPDSPIPVAPLPALSQRAVTFGCFNNPAKLTPEVIACWSKLLHALPDARLYLKYKSLEDDGVRKYFQNLFIEHGIDTERIRFSGQSPRDEYLESYNEIDICLDPFPFNGCTTTMEALWMGVPVITLRGDRYASHMGETILKNLDLHECVADSQDSYINKALKLGNDLPRLAELRSRLRSRLVDSPLCDGALFTRDLEAVYRKMWVNWCQIQTGPHP
jgi:predicted O-linked N-acetylglucosamine transferase (SPINDLY family)